MIAFLKIIFNFFLYNVAFFGFFLILIYIIQYRLKKISYLKYSAKVITFLHPNCNDGGGGEKVLWIMLKSLVSENLNTKIKINIVTGTDVPAIDILTKVKQRFDINYKNSQVKIELIRLKTAYLLKPFPNFTMLIQIVGQIVFAFELLLTAYSDMVIDSTGLPYMLPVTSVIGRSYCVAYVHYPLISYDMINDISKGVSGVHSRGVLSKFIVFRWIKIVYYYLIFFSYKFVGYFINHAFTNSTWTNNHIKLIWSNLTTEILYPPCSTKLYSNNKRFEDRKNQIVSFAQFRPEKNHKMQVRYSEW